MWIPSLPFLLPKYPVTVSKLACHCFPLLPGPLNSLSHTGVNGAPRTKAWALPPERNSEISASLFSPHFLLSQGAVCYIQPCETLSFCQKKKVLSSPCAPDCLLLPGHTALK